LGLALGFRCRRSRRHVATRLTLALVRDMRELRELRELSSADEVEAFETGVLRAKSRTCRLSVSS